MGLMDRMKKQNSKNPIPGYFEVWDKYKEDEELLFNVNSPTLACGTNTANNSILFRFVKLPNDPDGIAFQLPVNNKDMGTMSLCDRCRKQLECLGTKENRVVMLDDVF